MLCSESASYLIDTYVDLRLQGADRQGMYVFELNFSFFSLLFFQTLRSLTATPRQLESLIRLSESLAKMEV
jgi:DNA replicative helicase MCM subunit Mcm2 (Cdc46/Mcm family)